MAAVISLHQVLTTTLLFVAAFPLAKVYRASVSAAASVHESCRLRHLRAGLLRRFLAGPIGILSPASGPGRYKLLQSPLQMQGVLVLSSDSNAAVLRLASLQKPREQHGRQWPA